MSAERTAAVLVVFRKEGDLREVLLIRRAEREGDPWSGQLAFPGGHFDPGDIDLRATALREATEEVGLDPRRLRGEPRFAGSRNPGNRRDLVVSVYVSEIDDGAGTDLHPGPEASEVLWVPVRGLERVVRKVPLPGRGMDLEVDGFASGKLFIWGLTYRILSDLLGQGVDTQ